jgi:hypothetical protein
MRSSVTSTSNSNSYSAQIRKNEMGGTARPYGRSGKPYRILVEALELKRLLKRLWKADILVTEKGIR